VTEDLEISGILQETPGYFAGFIGSIGPKCPRKMANVDSSRLRQDVFDVTVEAI
jgi:hypothetical protein